MQEVIPACLDAGCQKADRQRGICKVLEDPAYAWRKGCCQAMTRNPDWEIVAEVQTAKYKEERKRARASL
ncbi:MAG: hypothetical protein PHI12_13255 [Dehalococcoidales bacterium]|nr:hypothetical protein [Dehalococcoidales bacterium]